MHNATSLASTAVSLALCLAGEGAVAQGAPSGNVLRATTVAPEPAVSWISMPLRVDLQPYFNAIEATLPAPRDDGWHGTRWLSSSIGERHWVERQPLLFLVSGSEVSVRVHFRYALKLIALSGIGGSSFQVQCGDADTAVFLDAFVGVTTRVSLQSDWRIAAQTTVREPSFPCQCRLFPLAFNPTPHLGRLLQGRMGQVGSEIDAHISERATFHAPAERVWAQLQRPIPLGEGATLFLRPSLVRAAPLTSSGTQLSTVVHLEARPEVRFGEASTPPPAPLPALEIGPSEDGLHLTLSSSVSYSELNLRLRSAIVGRRFSSGNGWLTTVTGTRLGSGPDGQIVITVTLDDDLLRNVRLVGHPEYDATSGVLSIPDLDVVVGDNQMLAPMREALRGSPLIGALRAAARTPLTDRIVALQGRINAALQRPLGDGFALSGHVDMPRVTAFAVTPDALVVHITSDGRAEVVAP